jgi:Flp pilus assembly protein TadG
MLTRDDDGQLTLLIIGYTFIAAVLVVAGVDVSKVFLARRALTATADSAALSAAQAVDRRAIYSGAGGGCGSLLPLDPASAEVAAQGSYAADATALRSTFSALDPVAATVTAGTVTVQLSGDVRVPFGGVLHLLLNRPSIVHVSVSATAESPVTGFC